MFPAERQAFLTWYDARVAEGGVFFHLDEELLAYCQSDVDILRRGCAAFRNIFIQQNHVDPFYEAKDSEYLRAFLTTLQGPHAYLPDPLDPREAFYGGRTNATKLYYEAKEEEEIKYVDVCSLYPYICKYGTYPLGHPEIKDHPPVSDLFDLHGLIQCRVLPPTDLYHPVLPYRIHGKLLFPLCRTCAEKELDESCPHRDEDQAWIKQEASGYPKGCLDPEEYIREIQQKEGVTLDCAHIRKNPGLRALAKACLNNHWGKFGQRVEFDRTEYISSPQRYFALLWDERCQVKDVNIINEDLLCVTYEPRPEFHDPHPAHNVVIAAWVTAQARLKLYSYLKPLDRRILYF
ncbi:uncharacterized protein [Haliotis asinina]|uniref:uncharacterized protein n=1 Tax=Haliotis asinina TaxID=109174 RepID=UPI0035321B7F